MWLTKVSRRYICWKGNEYFKVPTEKGTPATVWCQTIFFPCTFSYKWDPFRLRYSRLWCLTKKLRVQHPTILQFLHGRSLPQLIHLIHLIICGWNMPEIMSLKKTEKQYTREMPHHITSENTPNFQASPAARNAPAMACTPSFSLLEWFPRYLVDSKKHHFRPPLWRLFPSPKPPGLNI